MSATAPSRDDADLHEYRASPGHAAATAFHKTRVPLPAGFEVVHRDQDTRERAERPARFFKLVHHLHATTTPAPPEGFSLTNIFDDAWTHPIADLIDAAYHHTMNVDDDTVRSWRTAQTADPALWIGCLDQSGHLVGCAISELDPTVPEGILEWVQVHPDYQGQGIGKALVLQTLHRMAGRAAFAIVSGDLDNPTSPEQLYRACGFTGTDEWHIYTP